MRHATYRSALAATAITAALLVTSATLASAHPDEGGPPVVTDDPTDEVHDDVHPALHDFDIDGPLLGQDEFDIISGGPYAKVTKNLSVAGRGERLEANVTTDVWAHEGYAYTGTFSSDCSDGTDEDESGIWVWDVHNKKKPTKAGVIISPIGTKANDVKVFTNTAGNDILVFSNEVCGAGGVGGVMVFNVDDPTDPVFLTRVQVDDGNAGARADGLFYVNGLTDSGVHNMFLWSRDGVDYMGVSAELAYGNFKIFDITDPSAPALVSSFGPEDAEFADELAALGIDSFSDGDAAFWSGSQEAIDLWFDANSYIFNGFGASANRVMHDLFVNEDGTRAYVNFWDGGMFLLDITNPADPQFISQAIDQTSTDGEVNSHSVWTEDDVIVVEGEEDFAPYESVFQTSAGVFPASPGAINTSGLVVGDAVYVGLACDADSVPAATAVGQVALIQRGVCAFTTKGESVVAKGYVGMVVFNDAARGDALITMGGTPVGIPGVFVGHSVGLALAGVASAADLVIGEAAGSVNGQEVWNGWSGLRIWDYSDPANPVLASTFDTACSALEPGTDGAEGCMEGGTYSSHNLVIEDGIAYISWYSDGLLMVDISDPYNPVEVGRYHERGGAFEAQNGGAQDIWGVYKEENSPWIYASDRNGGLYVLKAYGQGSAKNGKAPRRN